MKNAKIKKVNPVLKQIRTLETQVRKQKEKLALLRMKAPKELVSDYELTDGKKKIKLSQLFGDKNELILVHNMGSDCPYCTLWADGFNGFTKHLENRAAFVIENDDAPATQSKFARSRGWTFKFVSSEGSSLKTDLGFKEENNYFPGVSTFVKDKKGKIYRVASSYFGPGDNYCSIWDLFDLLPVSKPEWGPKFTY